MRILLTGGTGLVGQRLGTALVRAGHELIVLSRSPKKAMSESSFPCTAFRWQGEEVEPSALKGVEAVIHLAGEPIASERWNEEKKKRLWSSRVDHTLALVESIKKSPSIRTFISASAVGFYGDRGDDVLHEENQAGESFLATLCARWEQASESLEGSGIGRAILRLGVVLDPSNGALMKMLPLAKEGLLGPIGNGSQWMSWIDQRDLTALIIYCLENEGVSGLINATSPQPVTNRTFTTALNNSLGRSNFLSVPAFALKLMYGEMAQVLLESQRAVPRALPGFKFRFHDINESFASLFPSHNPLEDWIESHQWIPAPVEEAFPFFESEANLESLTPSFLNFRVLKKDTPEMQSGTLIDYELKVRGIKLKWRTRIEEFKKNISFIDTQLSGPYKKWHHTHTFEELAGGTVVSDLVLFQLPIGRLGRLASPLVRRDVEEIFSFRRAKMAELFNSNPGPKV